MLSVLYLKHCHQTQGHPHFLQVPLQAVVHILHLDLCSTEVVFFLIKGLKSGFFFSTVNGQWFRHHLLKRPPLFAESPPPSRQRPWGAAACVPFWVTIGQLTSAFSDSKLWLRSDSHSRAGSDFDSFQSCAGCPGSVPLHMHRGISWQQPQNDLLGF